MLQDGYSFSYPTDLRASLEGVRGDPLDPVVSEAEGGEAGERPHYPRVQRALEVVAVQLEAVQRCQVGEGVRRHGVQTVVVQVEHLVDSRVSTDVCIMVDKSRGQPSNLSLAATRLQVFIPMAILLLLSVYVFGVSVYVYS